MPNLLDTLQQHSYLEAGGPGSGRKAGSIARKLKNAKRLANTHHWVNERSTSPSLQRAEKYYTKAAQHYKNGDEDKGDKAMSKGHKELASLD